MVAVKWSTRHCAWTTVNDGNYQSGALKLARNRSAARLGMNRYAPPFTVTKRGSAAVRSGTGPPGTVMWLGGSPGQPLFPAIGSLLSCRPLNRGLLHHVCCTNSNWLLML